MKAIIVYYNPEERTEIINGIYNNISYDKAVSEVGRDNILAYIPLKVSGKTYAERVADLDDKAIQTHYAFSIACWSYGELAEIQSFFEKQGRRYGLTKEFRENGII